MNTHTLRDGLALSLVVIMLFIYESQHSGTVQLIGFRKFVRTFETQNIVQKFYLDDLMKDIKHLLVRINVFCKTFVWCLVIKVRKNLKILKLFTVSITMASQEFYEKCYLRDDCIVNLYFVILKLKSL